MNYVFVTDRWRQDYQIHEVNLIGKCHYDVFPEIPDHWKAIHKSGLSGEVIKGTEETFPRQDGRVDYVNWVVMPWHDFNQKICGIDILSEVVTARVEAQQEINRLKSQIKKIVIEKTKRLEQLLKNEQKLNQFKSELMAIASHELRTPAGIILSTCQLLDHYQKAGQLDKVSTLIRIIQDSANSMKGAINGLLSTENIQSGTVGVHPEKVYPYDLVQEVCNELRIKQKSRQQIKLEKNTLPSIWLDPTILKQIIKNLLLNAIKYSPSRSVIKIVLTHRRDCFKIAVIDRGIGIQKQDLKMLAKPYFRAKNALRYAGTGMGLFTAYRFAELLNGKIECRSRLGHGAHFTLTLSKLIYEKNSGH